MFNYKSKNLTLPLSNIFLTSSDIHHYNTRSTTHGNYYIPRFNSTRTLKSLKFQGVKIWNDIPQHLKSLSFFNFKKQYKSHLLKKYS